MFHIISLKEGNLANLALLELCEDNSVRLLRTLNPDAADGVQGEEYGEEWTLSDRDTAAKAFRENGFWKTWTDINEKVCGGISLYDQLCDEGVRQFMEMFDHPLVFCDDKYDVANAVLSLSPGLYLFHVPMLHDIRKSEKFKTVYGHAIAGGMSKEDAYAEALQESSFFAVRIGFLNPDTGKEDETEFDVKNVGEAMSLFWNDFCKDNHWAVMPEIRYIESDKE